MTHEKLTLSKAEYEDLIRLHLCDWLEQVPRERKWDNRRQAYRQMAERLGGVALTSYDRVFALEARRGLTMLCVPSNLPMSSRWRN